MKAPLALLAALSLRVISCGGPATSTEGLRFEFEDDCSFSACGFEPSSGSVRYTHSLLAGEHGIALAPNTVARRVERYRACAERVSLVARCDVPTTVRLEVELSVVSRPGDPVRTETSSSEWVPGTEWELFTNGLLAYRPDEAIVESVTLRTGGAGTCVIDRVRIAHGDLWDTPECRPAP